MNTWLAWIHDRDVHRRENDGGRNYWDVYLEEIADRLGVPGPALGGVRGYRGEPEGIPGSPPGIARG